MMNQTLYEPIHETLYQQKLASGLHLVVLPKVGFVKKSATLIVPFGSIDDKVIVEGSDVPFVIPEGTAHFLEHMLFESTDDSISRQFALLGASVNAYTTYNRTAVYFSTTNGIEKPLVLLFDMLNQIRFKSEAIQKERFIIEKEIMMYKDDIEQEMYYEMMRSLYEKNAVRNDVAGSVESIQQIDATILQQAFDCFYHPQNMILVLTGDFAIEPLIDIIERHDYFQVHRPHYLRERIRHIESGTVFQEQIIRDRDLKTDLVMLGIKCQLEPKLSADKAALEEIVYLLLLDNYLGRATKNQRQMQAKKLINNTFDFSISCDQSFAHAILFTESKRPSETAKEWKKLLSELADYEPDWDGFIAQKQKIIGGFVQIFDSVTRINALLSDYFIRGVNIFELISRIEQLTVGDLKRCALNLAGSQSALVQYRAK